MADETDNLGDLSVNITGDFSELQDAIDDAVDVAQDGSDQIAAALDSTTTAFQDMADATELTGASLSIFQQALSSLEGDGESISSALALIAQSSETLGEDVAQAAQELLGGMAPAVQETADAAQEADQSVDALVSTLAELTDAEQENRDAFEQALSVYNDAVDAFAEGEASAGVLQAALDQLSSSADKAGVELEGLGASEHDAGEEAEGAEVGLAAMAEAMLAIGEALAITEGLKELVEESIEVYGATQQVAVSFELLGDSAEEAMEKVEALQQMSINLAVPMGDVEAAARRLAVSFQDVAGVDLDQVLTAAANAAGLTGRSFDAVTSSLQRIELTGAVTARQLVQLGVSWSQLADTMGVSIEQAQALLKKGGQDAVTDLQAVLATINTVAGNAAQAQAQTIKGQFTVLSNETEILFDNIGQLIAPIVLEVVSGLQSMVLWATEAVNQFEQLPAPIQDIGLAVAGLAIAIPAATLALGGLGLSIAGVQSLLPAIESGLAAIGIEASGFGAAIAAVGLPAAAVLGGVAAWIATIKFDGLIDGAENFGAAFTKYWPQIQDEFTGILNAIDTAEDAINDLIHSFSGVTNAVGELKALFSGTNWIVTFLDAAAPGLALLKDGLNLAAAAMLAASGDVGGALKILQTGFQIGTQQVEVMTNQFGFLGTGAKAAGEAMGETQTAGVSLAGSFTEVTGKAAAATTAVTEHATAQHALAAAVGTSNTSLGQAKTALDAAKQAYNDGTGSLANVEQAQLAYNAAVKASKTAVDDTNASWNNFLAGQVKVSDGVDDMNAVITTLNGLLAQGVTSVGGMDIATQLLPAAMQQAATGTQKLYAALQQLIQANVTGSPLMTVFGNIVGDAGTKAAAAAKQIAGAVDPTVSLGNAFAFTAGQGTGTIQMLDKTGAAATATVPTWEAAQKAIADYNTAQQNGEDVGDGTITTLRGTGAAATATVPSWQSAKDAAADYVTGQALIPGALGVVVQAQQAGSAAAIIGANSLNIQKDAQGNLTQATAQAISVQEQINQAWANGQLVVQKLNSTGIQFENTMVGMTAGVVNADGTFSTFAQILQKANQWTDSLGEVSNETADAILAEANAANTATTALNKLATAQSKVKGTAGGTAGNPNQTLGQYIEQTEFGANASMAGAGDGQQDLSSYLAQAIELAQDPASGGALGGGGVNQGQVDAMAQELANATGQVVTTLDGQFIPATEAATIAAQAQTNAQNAATAATTANTTAVTASTTATVAATVALTAAQTSFIGAATAGDDIVTSFSSLPATIQDFLDSVNGTLVAYDDTTGALEYTETAADGLTETLNASVAPNELNTAATAANTTATVSATSATETLASSTAAAAAGTVTLGAAVAAVASTAVTAAASIAQASTAVLGAVVALTAPGASAAAAGTAGGAGTDYIGGYLLGGPYVPPNPYGSSPLLAGQAGYGESSSTGTNVQLTVNVTGNTVASDQSIQMLATKVASAMTTQLRMVAGLKL